MYFNAALPPYARPRRTAVLVFSRAAPSIPRGKMTRNEEFYCKELGAFNEELKQFKEARTLNFYRRRRLQDLMVPKYPLRF
jgi:hypothetical protein